MTGSSLFVPLTVGLAFGVALERAGLGSARKLIGQFTLTDFTVFKVMFSAIVTAMLGSFWLGRLGLIDLSAVYVPETYVLPQAIGGLVFGIGFVVSGLCPGTSCVAAASGRIDGLAVVGGIFVGILGTGLAFPSIQSFYDSTSRGTWLLPDVFHLSYGAAVLVIVLIALGGFRLVEYLECRP